MKPKEFATPEQWLLALGAGLPVSIMPSVLAAQILGDTAGSVSKKLKSGDLDYVVIEGRRYVCANNLFEYHKNYIGELQKIRAFLEKLASQRRTIFYGELMSEFNMRSDSPPDRKKIGVMLGQISRQTYEEHGVLLSVIVHRKGAAPTSPGPGYWSLLDYMKVEYVDLDFDKDENPLEIVDEHMKKVWLFYSSVG